MRRLKNGIIISGTMAILLAAGSLAQDDAAGTIPLPEYGTVPDNYYECMFHASEASPNKMVSIPIAQGCMNVSNYHPHTVQSHAPTGHPCQDQCTAAYDTCVAQSAQGGEDPTCPIQNLTCQRTCPAPDDDH
jgi:hypothetical protein